MKRTGIHGAGFVSISDMANGAVGGAVAAAPWWDPNSESLCVWAAYQPKGAASLAISYVDLSGNGNNTGPGVAPTWDIVNGWKFNGSTQYLTTTFVPQSDRSQTLIVQFSNHDSVATKYLAGCRHILVSGMFHLSPLAATGVQYANYRAIQVNPALTAGNLCVAGTQGYRNGILDGVIAGTTSPNIYTTYIGCRNSAGVAADFIQAYIQALALYDCVLSGPQVLSVATAMSLL